MGRVKPSGPSAACEGHLHYPAGLVVAARQCPHL